MKKSILTVSGLLLGLLFLLGQTFVSVNPECPTLSAEQILKRFYQKRSQDLLEELKKSGLTYSQKYDRAIGVVYPPTFSTDVVACVPPYDQKGELFAFEMRNMYDNLQKAPSLDIKKLAQDTVKEIVLNTRDIDVLKWAGPSAKQGDMWYGALALMGQYDQLAQFINTETNLDKNVFIKRSEEIKDFAVAFSNTSYDFIVNVLRDLQTNQPIAGANVQKYLRQNVSSEIMRFGISREKFIDNLMRTIPTPQQFLEQAEQINPSLEKELMSAWKGVRDLSAMTVKAEGVFAILNLFKYSFPSTYIEMLENMSEGKITHQQINQALAESLAADALNKRLAQVANDLFEVERIFYYPGASVGENVIGNNWKKLAENEYFSSSLINRLAADNIMRSGGKGRKYQTNKIAQLQLQERVFAELDQTTQAGKEIALFAADIIIPAGIGKLLEGGKAVEKAAKAAETAAQMQKDTASAVTSAGKRAGAATRSTGAASPGREAGRKAAKRYAPRQAAGKITPEKLLNKVESLLQTEQINGLSKLKTYLQNGDIDTLKEVAKAWGHYGKNIKVVENCIKDSVCLNQMLEELPKAKEIISQIGKGRKDLQELFPQHFIYRSGTNWATEVSLAANKGSSISVKQTRKVLDALGVKAKDMPYLYKNGKVLIGDSRNLKGVLDPIAKQQRKLLQEKGLHGTQHIRWGTSEFATPGKGIDHLHLETVVIAEDGSKLVWNTSIPVEFVSREPWLNQALFVETLPVHF